MGTKCRDSMVWEGPSGNESCDGAAAEAAHASLPSTAEDDARRAKALIDLKARNAAKKDLIPRGGTKIMGSLSRTVEKQILQTVQSSGTSVREIFNEIDQDGNGLIDLAEFKKALCGNRKEHFRSLFGGLGLNWKEVFANIDSDEDGMIDLEEFELAFQK